MRYTHKLDKPDGNCNYFLIPDQEQCDAAENKLGKLEDIEEELGVDLITLLNEHPDAKHLLYNLIHNISFVFAPKGEKRSC